MATVRTQQTRNLGVEDAPCLPLSGAIKWDDGWPARGAGKRCAVLLLSSASYQHIRNILLLLYFLPNFSQTIHVDGVSAEVAIPTVTPEARARNFKIWLRHLSGERCTKIFTLWEKLTHCRNETEISQVIRCRKVKMNCTSERRWRRILNGYSLNFYFGLFIVT